MNLPEVSLFRLKSEPGLLFQKREIAAVNLNDAQGNISVQLLGKTSGSDCRSQRQTQSSP